MFNVKLQSIRILHSSFFTSYIPGILGMPGIPFMRLIICAILLPVIICIIFRVWSNCLMSLFTSWMLVPEPLAMRWRRDVLRMAGLVRSLESYSG